MPNIIQTGTAVAVDRSKTAGIYTAVKPFGHIQSTNPTVAIGYQQAGSIVMLSVTIQNTTIVPASVVSSKAADGTPNVLWQTCSAVVTDTTIGVSNIVFMGVVHNVGTDIITVTFTGGTPSNSQIAYDWYEFNGGYGPLASWLLDVVSSTDKAASTSLSFPGHSIRYATTELFFSFLCCGSVPTPGATAGFSYDTGSLANGGFGIAAYHLAYPSGSSGATGTQASSTTYTQMSATLAIANVQDTTDTACVIDFSNFIPTGLMWIIYQISFEIQTSAGIQNQPSARIFQNGRVIETSPVPGAAKGPPFFTIRPGDFFTVEIDDAPLGAQLVVDVLYQEWPNGEPLHIAGVV